MKSIKIYEYNKCSTCKNAIKALKGAGYEVQTVPIIDAPPTATELKELVAKSGLELKKFFNTSGELYKAMGLKDKLSTLSEQEQLELLASNGKLIKRPIATDGTKVSVGFKPEQYAEVWGE